MTGYAGIDFETYCVLDLKVVGLRRYVEHPSFKVLLCSIDSETLVADFDFVEDAVGALSGLNRTIQRLLNLGEIFTAHNSGFEQAVLRAIGIFIEDHRIIDSAEVGRTVGAESRLGLAARQLIEGHGKMEEGADLIQKYCVGPTPPTWEDVKGTVDWKTFKDYCRRDAWLSRKLMEWRIFGFSEKENLYSGVTHRMNDKGWRVDLELVKRMQQQYEDNLETTLRLFRERYDPKADLNFNSPAQLQEWCKERGIIATSFTEDKVKVLLDKIDHKLTNMSASEPRWHDYMEVMAMLQTKIELGGSSLSKLQTILNLTAADGRLHDQYVHIGAGQSYRTSGRGVQLQNLKRLPAIPDDVQDLMDGSQWSNSKLAANLRQVFTAGQPNGLLIVGDFSSIEARGLAWLAGAQWKLDAFAKGKDMYKVLASQMYHSDYEEVTKAQRQAGKVGELSCGYQAGGPTVSVFANKMGVAMSVDEASDIVFGWRRTNIEIVTMWTEIDAAMKQFITSGRAQQVELAQGQMVLEIFKGPTIVAHPLAVTMMIRLRRAAATLGNVILERTFPGVYLEGNTIRYHKATRTIKGTGWADCFWDQDQKKWVYYTLYGGKVTGILTQSLCREMFFASMIEVEKECNLDRETNLIGQFHDEMVVEWIPLTTRSTPDKAIAMLQRCMEMNWLMLKGFPLAAEIKYDYRYTK